MPLGAADTPKPPHVPVWASFERSMEVESSLQSAVRSKETNQSLRIRTRYLDPAVQRTVGFVANFHHFNKDLTLDESPNLDEAEWLGQLGISFGRRSGKHQWNVDLLGTLAGTTLGPTLGLGGEHRLGYGWAFYHQADATAFTGATQDFLLDADQGLLWRKSFFGISVGYRIVSAMHLNRNGPKIGLRVRFNSPKIPFIFPSVG